MNLKSRIENLAGLVLFAVLIAIVAIVTTVKGQTRLGGEKDNVDKTLLSGANTPRCDCV